MRLFFLLGVVLLGALAAGGAEADVRFSQTLTAGERSELSLTRFSSDQVAILDALVRRDIATQASGRAANLPAAFSQRLTPIERTNAGLTLLSPAEISRLDALVERHQAGRLARTLLAPPVSLARGARIETDNAKPARQIHGTFSLSYGMGSGGYSEQTGSMVLRMDDPEHHYSISVGYSESHIKGGNGYYRDDPRILGPGIVP